MKRLLSIFAFSVILLTTSAKSAVTCTLESVYGNITYGSLQENNFGYLYTGQLKFDKFSSFCIDPLREVYFGQTLTYNIQSAQGLTGADTIARIVSEYDASNQTPFDAVATQWAIWKIIQDGTNSSFSLGNVQVPDSATASAAQSYINNAHKYSPAEIVIYHNDKYQDQVVEDHVAFNKLGIPENSTLIFLSIATCLLLYKHRTKI